MLNHNSKISLDEIENNIVKQLWKYTVAIQIEKKCSKKEAYAAVVEFLKAMSSIIESDDKTS
jgi:hypothetical protein